ncbi:MAG: hypothetical protein ACOC9T_03185, partial [Myxococcota bacterium]
MITHRCRAPGCQTEVAASIPMCGKHWEMLPQRIKDRILETSVPGQSSGRRRPSKAWTRATRDAVDYIAAREATPSRRMKGLTMIRPWDECLFAPMPHRKRVENRGWAPWSDAIGQTIAIHAGTKYDMDVHGFAEERGVELLSRDGSHRSRKGAVVGLVRVRGFAHWTPGHHRFADLHDDSPEAHELARQVREDPWFCGPFGWLFVEPISLPEPVRCKGALGLWTLPIEVEEEV